MKKAEKAEAPKKEPTYSDYQHAGKKTVGATALVPTGADIEGPFYKPNAPARYDISEGGEPKLILSGTLLATDGTPVAEAVLDFWQADPTGKYDLEGFKHRGKVTTDAHGNYTITTVKPGDYDISEPDDPQPHEFRCAHIHLKVWVKKKLILTTQLYFRDDQFNATDRWFDASRVIDVNGKFNLVVAVKSKPI